MASVMTVVLCAWSCPKTGSDFSGSCAGSEAIFPAKERRADEDNEPVGQLAKHCEGQDRGHDLRRFAELLAVDQQVTEPFGGAHELGRDDEHPPKAKPG